MTHLGAFQLTAAGLLLVTVFPGVDPVKDIVEPAPAKILLPPGGAAAITVLSGEVLAGGSGFTAQLAKALKEGAPAKM